MSDLAGSPVVIFDCDNTLIAGDVLKSFIIELLGHGRRMAAAVVVTPLVGPLLLLHPTRRLAISTWLWVATAGRSESEMGWRMDAYVDHHLGEHRSAVISQGMTRLRDHLGRGDRVVIATAAAEPLAQRLLLKAGLGDLTVIASSVTRFAGGWTLSVHCWGPFKPQLLAAAGIPGPYRAGYSDSLVDLPLLRLAADAVLVNPARLVATRMRRALPNLSTVSWT